MGRRKKEPPENATDKITNLAERGVAETKIANSFGIGYDTWLRWKQDHKYIKQALEQARQIEEEKLVGVLFEQALDGDRTAAMFLLKTRHGYLEGNPQMAGNAVQVNISVPGSMNPEEYQKTIENE